MALYKKDNANVGKSRTAELLRNLKIISESFCLFLFWGCFIVGLSHCLYAGLVAVVVQMSLSIDILFYFIFLPCLLFCGQFCGAFVCMIFQGTFICVNLFTK